ncbi:metal cation symporter ZIP14-like [Patiria miniata]|uniref:Uncharacterized protein n=1 Tax=Patiria miniata TaxID=46514 RepID=A0A914B9M2_PATMI|nr:metal cation symporter ZIP14-like [Patiria miniata]
MASFVSLACCLKACVLCLMCTAMVSECTKLLGKELQNSRPGFKVITEGKSVGADAAIVTSQQLDTKDISPEDHLSCRQFFKREICDECFIENNSVSSNAQLGGTASRRDGPVAPATINELARVGSVLVSKLQQGTCALGRSTVGRVRRSVVVGDIDASLFVEAIYEKYGTSGVINEDQFDSLLQDLGVGKLMATTTAQSPTNHSDSDDDHTAIKQCFLADDLVAIFNASKGIPEERFASICPSLIQQITQGCVAPVTPPTELDLKMYAWATIAVASITILSMLAMIAVPTHGSRFYAAVMQLFVALAVSSLSGDALLHLLPEALGIHGMPKTEGQPNHILITLTVILAVYFFFVFERLMSLCLKGKPHGHGHVHSRPRRETFIEDDECGTHLDAMKEVGEKYHHESTKTDENHDGKQDDQDTISNKEVEETTTKDMKLDKDKEAASELPKSQQTIFGLNMLSVMVLIGDVVHNITDGITIGVSFVNGPFAGISTTIAVFFHEVPHEIGDFAVLLRSGVSFRKAMLCSLISNMIGFAGLYAGLLLGSENVIQRWIFAATAGMFLYIALVSLVPEMNQQAEEAERNPWRVFLRHNIGLLLGWTVMLALGVYEQYTEDLF